MTISILVIGKGMNAKFIPLSGNLHQLVKRRNIVTGNYLHILFLCQPDIISGLLGHPTQPFLLITIQWYDDCLTGLNGIGCHPFFRCIFPPSLRFTFPGIRLHFKKNCMMLAAHGIHGFPKMAIRYTNGTFGDISNC